MKGNGNETANETGLKKSASEKGYAWPNNDEEWRKSGDDGPANAQTAAGEGLMPRVELGRP